MMNKLIRFLAGLLGAALAILSAVLAGKKIGKAELEKKQAEKSLKQAKEAHEIESEVRSLDDAELNKRLRKHERQ